ncbi:MAG: porin family protein [Deferribacteraceae bacterium]|jgi:hypothetical protein|nr:porin family protein [Deferribacteraceae bacterium]
MKKLMLVCIILSFCLAGCAVGIEYGPTFFDFDNSDEAMMMKGHDPKGDTMILSVGGPRDMNAESWRYDFSFLFSDARNYDKLPELSFTQLAATANLYYDIPIGPVTIYPTVGYGVIYQTLDIGGSYDREHEGRSIIHFGAGARYPIGSWGSFDLKVRYWLANNSEIDGRGLAFTIGYKIWGW